MSIYVVEIAGRGVVAFNATNRDEAHGFATKDGALHDDLMVLEFGGKPLRDGEAELFVRDAFPEEQARWQASQARASRDGEIEEEDDPWVLFLVPVSDPTDDEV